MPPLWILLFNVIAIRYFMIICTLIHEELSYNPNSYFYSPITNKHSSSSSSSKSPIPQIIKKLSNTPTHHGHNYTNWATLLSNAHHLSFKDTTIFIPDNDAVVEPMMFHYHIASQRFTFTELIHYTVHSIWNPPSPLYFDPRRLLNPGARVSSLARGRNLFFTIIEDGSTPGSTTAVNGVPITRPDLYKGANVCVHGIKRPLELPSFDSFDNPDAVATSTLWFRALFVVYSYYAVYLVRDLRTLAMWESAARFVVVFYIVDFVYCFIVSK